MELLDLPELYKAFSSVQSSQYLKPYLVPNSDIDMINNTLSELSGEIILFDHCLALSIEDEKYVYTIRPTYRLTEILIYEDYIDVFVPEDLFLKMVKLDCLVKLPYNYFCYTYEYGANLESTLKRIKDYGIN